MAGKSLQIYGKQAVFHTSGAMCGTAAELVASEFFLGFLASFLEHLRAMDHPVLEKMDQHGSATLTVPQWQQLLAAICEQPLPEAALALPHAVDFLAPHRRKALLEFLEAFYDYWRSYDRYMVLTTEAGPGGADQRPYRAFNTSVEAFTQLVRGLYREWPRTSAAAGRAIYRQVAAGAEVGVSPRPQAGRCRRTARSCSRHPLHPPGLDVPADAAGPADQHAHRQFTEVAATRSPASAWSAEQWLCYPALVGRVVVFVYFHQRFAGLGLSLANLFEHGFGRGDRRRPRRRLPLRRPRGGAGRVSASCPRCSTTTPRVACSSRRCPWRTASATSATSRRWSSRCTTWPPWTAAGMPFHGA